MRRTVLTIVCGISAALASSISTAGENAMKATPRNLNTHHLFTAPATRSAWENRAAALKTQLLFSAGLYPMPEKTPLNPRVTGKMEGDDFVIENVAIETYPGFFLCGNVYRPKGKQGPFPAILNPHGHWANGRLQMEADVPLAEPPPAKPAKGMGNFVALGVNLARQGFIVFAYDMIGYNDTIQIPQHREFAKDVRPWLWSISLNGVQLWNSIRALDYLAGLPDVDSTRLGVTGASGGATQTFQLCAVDDRIKVAVPVNMISAHMQGGCLCENAPLLRVGTDNVEIAAAMAPKPLLLVAATGDWTKNNPTEEWPAIKKVYDLFGAAEKTAVRQFNYGHNYNIESREAMYAWFGRWLLNDTNAEHFREKPMSLDVKALRVWNEKNPLPANALKDSELIQKLKEQAENQVAVLLPKNKKELKRFQSALEPALRCSLQVGDAADNVMLEAFGEKSSKAVLLVTSLSDASPDLLSALKESGSQVFVMRLPSVEENAEQLWAEFFTTYNRTATGERVQRVVDALESLKREKFKRIDLIGAGQGGLWALLARGLSPISGSAAIDAAKFKSGDDNAYVASLYAPGLRRIGLQSAAILGTTGPLCLFNTGDNFDTGMITKTYKALDVKARIEPGILSAAEVAKWIKK